LKEIYSYIYIKESMHIEVNLFTKERRAYHCVTSIKGSDHKKPGSNE